MKIVINMVPSYTKRISNNKLLAPNFLCNNKKFQIIEMTSWCAVRLNFSVCFTKRIFFKTYLFNIRKQDN